MEELYAEKPLTNHPGFHNGYRSMHGRDGAPRSVQFHGRCPNPADQPRKRGADVRSLLRVLSRYVNGKGDGPSATALKTPPADLTVLSKNNGGKFPAGHVKTVLQFGPNIPSHGAPEMPVWGPVLGKMDVAGNHDTQLRISNLSRYLEAIQEK